MISGDTLDAAWNSGTIVVSAALVILVALVIDDLRRR